MVGEESASRVMESRLTQLSAGFVRRVSGKAVSLDGAYALIYATIVIDRSSYCT